MKVPIRLKMDIMKQIAESIIDYHLMALRKEPDIKEEVSKATESICALIEDERYFKK